METRRVIKTQQGFGRKAPKTVEVVTKGTVPSTMEQLNRKIQETQQQHQGMMKTFGRYL